MKQSEVSRSERRSMLFIQVALLLVVAVGTVFFVFIGRDAEQQPAGNDRRQGRTAQSYYAISSSVKEAESFPFDPNTADSTELLQLGLTPYQVRSIYRYRAKGGAYHRPEQFKKLYGLTVQQWEHLRPLIRIGRQYKYLSDTPDAYVPAQNGYSRSADGNPHRTENVFSPDTSANSAEAYGRRSALFGKDGRRDTTRYPLKLRPGQTIELNHADTTALKRIPGIGSYYARKIVEQREKLGGFISLAQLEEMENIPSGIEAYLTLDARSIRPLRINHATQRQLNTHPYLSYYQSRTIHNHRHQYGPIRSFTDLSLYPEFSEDDFRRLAPYVDFSE